MVVHWRRLLHSGEDAIERRLHANHLTLHDQVLALEAREPLDAAVGHRLDIFLFGFLKDARRAAQLAASTGSVSFAPILALPARRARTRTTLWDVPRGNLRLLCWRGGGVLRLMLPGAVLGGCRGESARAVEDRGVASPPPLDALGAVGAVRRRGRHVVRERRYARYRSPQSRPFLVGRFRLLVVGKPSHRSQWQRPVSTAPRNRPAALLGQNGLSVDPIHSSVGGLLF